MNDLSDLTIHDDEEDNGMVFVDESDIIEEVASDDEELPDADDDDDDDSESEHDDEIHHSQHIIFTGDEIDHSLHIFTGHNEEEVYTVACSPTDNALVATGGGDDKGFLWKIGQGHWTSELNGHTDSVSSLAFSYDGKLLASGDLDGIVQVWDTLGNLKCSLEGPSGNRKNSPEDRRGIEWLRWHPRGNILLAGGSEDYNVWMWDADKPSFGKVFVGHGDSVTCGDFTPDGKTICTGSDDATLRVWNPKTVKCIHVVNVGKGHPYTDGLTCLSISSSSVLALTGSKDGSVHIVNITTGRVIKSLPSQSDSIECVGFAPSGLWAAVGSMDNNMVIWEWNREPPLARSTCEHEDGVLCLAWLGTWYVATGCRSGVVRIWDSRFGVCVKTFREHSDAIQSLALSVNGDHLVSASSDGTARVFEVGEFR